MITKFRDLLALVYIGVVVLWLSVVMFFILPLLVNTPQSVDPVMALVTGLGVGGITQFFVVIGTLVFQFYFRKSNTEAPS